MFLLYSDLSSVISIHHRYHFVCMIPIHCCRLWQVIISVISFSALFANGIKICSTSAAQMPFVLHNAMFVCVIQVHWLLISAGHCSDYLFPALFTNQILICFMSVAHISPVPSLWCLPYVGDFELVIFPVSLFLSLLLTRHWFVCMSAALVH